MEPTVTISLTQFEELTRDKKVLDWLEENADTIFYKFPGKRADRDNFRLDIRNGTMEVINRDAQAAKD
jgi:hypothetical protein